MRVAQAVGLVGILGAAAAAAGQASTLVDLTLPSAQNRVGPLTPVGGTDGCSSDDFNRPDGPIGGDWGPGAGTFGNWAVSGNRGKFSTPLFGGETIVHTTASEPFAGSVQVLDVETVGTALQYIALMGGMGGGNNIFIKVQQQAAGGTFETCGFYQGNNGGGWPGGLGFFALTAPFPSARLKVSVDAAGDMVTLEIDTDFNGTPDQTYTSGGAAALAPGTGFGLGGFGVASFDNWATCDVAPCYPDCNGVGGLTIADFGCFQTRFVAGDPYADCNGVGGLTIADFACFQTAFVAGCP